MTYRACATENCKYYQEEKDRKSYYLTTVKLVWIDKVEQQREELLAHAFTSLTVDYKKPEKGKVKEKTLEKGDLLKNIINLLKNREEYVVWNIFLTDRRRVMYKILGTLGHYITSIGQQLGCRLQVGDKLTVFHINQSQVGQKKETETTQTPYIEMLYVIEPL